MAGRGAAPSKALSGGLGVRGWVTALSTLCQRFLKVDHHKVGEQGSAWVPCLGKAEVFDSRPQVEEEYPGPAP